MINFNNNTSKNKSENPTIATNPTNFKKPPPPMMVMISDNEKNNRTPRQHQQSQKSVSSTNHPNYNPFSNTINNDTKNITKKQRLSKDQDEVNNTILEEEQSLEQSKIHNQNISQSNSNSSNNSSQKLKQKNSIKSNKKKLSNDCEKDQVTKKKQISSEDSEDEENTNEQQFVIKINVQNHTNFPENIKIPNANYNILEQAKYMIMQEITNTKNDNANNSMTMKEVHQYLLTEDILSRTIKQIHIGLLKLKELEHEKVQSDYYKQIMSLQAQIQNLTLNQTQNQSTTTPMGLKKTLQTHFQNKLFANINPSEKSGMTNKDGTGGLGLSSSLAGTGQVILNDSLSQLYDQQKVLSNQEEVKRYKEELKDLTLKSQFLEQDLSYQAQKTKELQTKYESEIENLRSQLKGSQSEQFIRQQVEHKKLIEDNSVLMREVKILQDQLREEQQKVLELFEDAQAVREEIINEMTQFEKMKREQDKIKQQNQILRQRLGEQGKANQQSHDISIDSIGSINDLMQDNEAYTDHNGLSYGGGLANKQSKIQKVSVGLSRPESLLSLANDFNQKLEDLIEQKSKSIVNMITKSQVNQFSSNYQQPQVMNYQGTSHFYQGFAPYIDTNIHAQPGYTNQARQQNVVELSYYESENGGNKSSSNLENHISPDSSHEYKQQILKSNSSDLQMLKHKIKQVRDQHTQKLNNNGSTNNISNISSQQLLNNRSQYQQQHLSSQNIIPNFQKNSSNDLQNLQQLYTHSSQTENTFKAINSGVINQEQYTNYVQKKQPKHKKNSSRNNNDFGNFGVTTSTNQISNPHHTHDFMLRTGQSSQKDEKHDYQNNDDQNMMQLTQQFKTPVWTTNSGRVQNRSSGKNQILEDKSQDEDEYQENQDIYQQLQQQQIYGGLDESDLEDYNELIQKDQQIMSNKHYYDNEDDSDQEEMTFDQREQSTTQKPKKQLYSP